MALLCEGSTIREGKYRDNIRRAVNYLMDRAQPNGLIGLRGDFRYLQGHGLATMFLSCVVGEEENARRREKLVSILEKACKYTRDAQTSRGGWGDLTAKEGNDFDASPRTITQIQALRAARNAGIIVPNNAIKDAQNYLQDSTDDQGGVRYSLASGGGGGLALTAAAIACGFSSGDYKGDLVKKWLGYFQRSHPSLLDGQRIGHDVFAHYYSAQVVYVLGEDRFKKLFPDAREDELLTWKKYRKSVFDEFKRTQGADGCWTARMVGPVYVTACYLTVLQLDKAALPIYMR
jgi:hypothetical protein